MFDVRMEHLFTYTIQLGPPELIGPVVEGVRAHFPVVSGKVEGPKFNGTFRPVGADWFCLRRDGVGEPDVRATIETTDGALIYLTYKGLGDLGEDGYEKFLRGELPPRLPLKSAPTLRSAHPQYQWLHRLFCIGIGEFDSAALNATYDIYAVR